MGRAGRGTLAVSAEGPALARTVEALLFLSSDPLTPAELADAAQAEEAEVLGALALLAERHAPGRSGICLRELGGGWTLSSDPGAEEAARRLFSRPRMATLTPPQAETLGLIEPAGHSQFGAVLYRTTTHFLKLFGLRSLEELPDVARWDPSPEEQAELRERLLRAGEARAGSGPTPG